MYSLPSQWIIFIGKYSFISELNFKATVTQQIISMGRTTTQSNVVSQIQAICLYRKSLLMTTLFQNKVPKQLCFTNKTNNVSI